MFYMMFQLNSDVNYYYSYNVHTAVKHNPLSGNLRALVKKWLELATNLRDESQCERFVKCGTRVQIENYSNVSAF